MVRHVALAYSGGLDTSYLVHWIATQYDAKVTAVLVDLGQDPASIEDACQRALHNGAADCIVVPAEDAFVQEMVAPAIHANALYQGVYPLATALARPIIARALVDVANQVGADAVAHGCTGKGNDQVRIEASVKALAPGMTTLAPQRSHPFTRDTVLAYAAAHGLALPPLKSSPFSVDENLWGRSAEGNELEDPGQPVPEAAYALTTAPAKAPDEGATFMVAFHQGLPSALDGVPMPLPALIAALNGIAGAHGVGRIDHVEDRLVGIKSREVYEAPAAVAILTAKKALEALVLAKDELAFKPALEQRFAELAYNGQWFSPLRNALQAFFAQVQAHVTGTVTLHACKGLLTVVSRQAPASLYDHGLATYETGDGFHHQAAEGFIELWSLPMEVATRVRSGVAPVEPVAPITSVPPLAPMGPLVAESLLSGPTQPARPSASDQEPPQVLP